MERPEQETARNPVWRLILKVLAFCMIVATVALGVAIAYLNWTTDRAVEAYFTELEARGAFLAYDAIPAPRVRPPEADEIDPAGNAAIKILLELHEQTDGFVQRGSPESDEFYRLVSLLVYDRVLLSEQGLSAEDRIAARKLLSERDDVLETGRLATELPPATKGGMIEALDMEGLIYDWPVPNLLAMRGMVNLFAVEALLKLDEGDTDAALAVCSASLQFSQHLSDHPTILANTIGGATVLISLEAAKVIAHDSELQADAIRKFLIATENSYRFDSYYNALNADRLGALAAWRRDLGRFLEDQNMITRVYGSDAFRFWRNWDILGYLFLHQSFYEAIVASEGVGGRRFAHEATKLREVQRRFEGYPMCGPDSVFLPDFERIVQARARLESMLSLARISYAAILFEIENGRYPGQLDELAPDILDEVPLDPCSGTDFIYEPGPNGFLVYGVGIDREDDGGVHDYETGDIVWDLRDRRVLGRHATTSEGTL